MGKLTLWMQMSVDGYAEGPGGAFDWAMVGQDLQQLFVDELGPKDAFLYGRRVYEMMASFWPTADSAPGANELHAAYARLWRPMPKVVFSRTLTEAGWNSTVVGDDVAGAVNDLKARSEHGVVFFGGPDTAVTLSQLGLIDEYMLFVHPVALGGGKPVLGGLEKRLRLRHLSSTVYEGGVTALRLGRAD